MKEMGMEKLIICKNNLITDNKDLLSAIKDWKSKEESK